MKREIVFVLEPDCGRVTVESSQAAEEIAREIKQDLGQGNIVNCARPAEIFRGKTNENAVASDNDKLKISPISSDEYIHLYRLYHHSTVDGPGRRSVIQVAGCSIRCAGCYVPETHERSSGKLTSIDSIVGEIDKKSGKHDGVTIIGGEPFDQAESLASLVIKLKAKDYHLTVYSGFTLEELTARKDESINLILSNVDLLIDGAFDRNLTKGAGEYRGSSNQRLIFYPITRIKMHDAKTNLQANDEEKRKQSEAEFNQFMAKCLDEGWSPTKCPHGCVVEPDGVCPHDFKSVALEYGFV